LIPDDAPHLDRHRYAIHDPSISPGDSIFTGRHIPRLNFNSIRMASIPAALPGRIFAMAVSRPPRGVPRGQDRPLRQRPRRAHRFFEQNSPPIFNSIQMVELKIEYTK
jgi:hypothetical protein